MKPRKMAGCLWLPRLKITRRDSGSYCSDRFEKRVKEHGEAATGFLSGDKREEWVFHVKQSYQVSRETFRWARKLG